MRRSPPMGSEAPDEALLRLVAEAHPGHPEQPHDEILVAKAARAALARTRPSERRRVPWWRTATALAGVGLFVGAAGAALSVPTLERWWAAARPSAVSSAAQEASQPVPPAAVPEAPQRPAAAPSAPPGPQTRPSSPMATTAPVGEPATPEAVRLFDEARRARALGWDALAAARFEAVFEQHPESPEAAVSRIAAARLHQKLGDYPRALAAFEGYLANAPSGPLHEEALAGRAEVLSALQRSEEARRAFDDLARAYPRSPYLPRTTGTP